MDLDGRRMVRVTGGDWSLNDGGETTIVINDVMLLRRGNGEHRLAMKFCGLTWEAKRSNRGFLLSITGIIASIKNSDSIPWMREHQTPNPDWQVRWIVTA